MNVQGAHPHNNTFLSQLWGVYHSELCSNTSATISLIVICVQLSVCSCVESVQLSARL